jgi:hypothetical protein
MANQFFGGGASQEIELDSVNLDQDILQVYDLAGDININAGWTDITMDSERIVDAAYTHSNGEITFNQAGKYTVSYYITTRISSGSGRTDSEARLVIDTGSGYNEVLGSRGGMYNRTAAYDLANASVTLVLAVSEGDKIKLQAQRDTGGDTIVTYPNSCGITCVKQVSQGDLLGLVGPQGPPGNFVWQGQWMAGVYLANNVVQHNGSSFIVNKESTSEEPSIGASDWDLVVERGDDGPSGSSALAIGRVNSGGTIVSSRNLTCSKTGTGTYVFSFDGTSPVDTNYVVLVTFNGSAANVQDWTAVITDRNITNFTVVTTSEDNGGTADPPTDLAFELAVLT